MHAMPISSVVGLVLALAPTSFLAFRKRPGKNAAIRPSRHLLVTWGLCLALLCVVVFWERRPLSSLGIETGNVRAWGIGALVGVAVLAMSGALLTFARDRTMKGSTDGLVRLAATPGWFRVAAVLTAGITEEIVFRGYPIERLFEATGLLWLAALIPLVVFTVAHLRGWSASHLVAVFFGGLVLTSLYLWQRDLIACMIAHTIIDAPIIFLPMFMKRIAAAAETAARPGPTSASPGAGSTGTARSHW